MSNRLDYFKKLNSRTWLNNPNSGAIENPPPEKSLMDTVTDVAENVANGIDNNIRWVSNKLHKDDVDYSSTGKDYLSGTNSYNASDTTANTFPGNGEINNDKLSNHTIEIPEKIKQFYKIPEDVKKLYNMSPIGLLGGLAYQATALDKSLSNKIIDDGKNYVNESTAPTWLKNFQEANLNALKNTQEYNYNVPKSFINGLSNVYGGISDLFGLDSGNELNYVREKTNPNKSFSGKIFSKEFFTDPEGLTYTLPNAIGSMVALAPSAYLAPSYLIKLIQSTSNPMIKKAAELALRGAMTAFPESMAEGGSVVRESKENNLDNPYLRGWATTMSNLPMLMASNATEYTLLGGKGINPLYGKTLSKRLGKATLATGANAMQNGAEEFIQQGIQNKWTDKDYSFNPLNAPQDQIDAMQTGMIVGGGLSATPSVIRATTGNPDFDKYINNASKETNVPADIIKEVGNVESSSNPNAVSNQGAVGYMQLMPSTAEAMGVKDITDPEQNIMGGAKYLKYLYDKYGNWKDTLIAYNEGEGNFDNGKRFSESIEYANKILDNIDDKNIINLPDKKYYNILDEVSDTGLTELTEQKLNLLARDFYKKFGYNLDVTSMKRNGDGSSWHDSGQAIDVVSDILENEPEARAWIIEQGKKYGLTSLDEYTNPSANATGGHIHFSDHGDPLPGIFEKNTSISSSSNDTDYTMNNDFSNMQADDITLYNPAKVDTKTKQNDPSNLENLSEDEKWDILDAEIEKATNSDIDYLDKLTKIKVNKDIPALDNLINKIKTTDKKFLTKIQAKRGKTFTEEQKSQIDLATKELEQLYSENKFLEAMKKAEDIEYMKKEFVADNTFKTNTTTKPKADTNKIKTLGYDLLKQLQKRNIEVSNTNNVVNYDKIKSALNSNDINKQKDALTIMQYILNLLKNDKKTISGTLLKGLTSPNNNIANDWYNKINKDLNASMVLNNKTSIEDTPPTNAGNIDNYTNKLVTNLKSFQNPLTQEDINLLYHNIKNKLMTKNQEQIMQKKLDKTLSNEENQQIKKETLIHSNSAVDVAAISDDSTVRLSQDSNNVGATKEWRPASVKSNVSSTNIISNDNINNNISDNDIYNNAEQKISSFNLANGYKTESGKTLAKANENEFIIKPNGSMDFGEITEIISKATGGELLPGKIRLRVGNEKQGLIHAKKHEKQAKHIGYNSIEDMISDVANNFDVIYKKDNGDGKRATYSLVKLNNNDVKAKQNVVPTYFELQNEDNGYYYIITAIPKNIVSFKNQIKKETLIYSKQGQDIATISSDSAVRLSQSNNKTGVTEERLPISVKSNVSSTNIIPNDNISDNQNESEVNENELNDSSNPMAPRDKQGNDKNNVGTDDESNRSSRTDGRDVQQNSERRIRTNSSTSIRRDSTNSGGKTSNSTIRQEKSTDSSSSSRDIELSRSITDSYERPLANETTAKTITQSANESLINERNLNKQKQVNNQNIKVGNLESIKNDLPLLLPEQQNDVLKSEHRMFINNKPGILFTNGTGTGKTFTGLGIVKRFTNMGKNNILIVSPGTGINSSWIDSGKKFFNLNIVPLKNKKDNGGNNIVITTLNNFTSNKTLVNRAWDLIIIDESHKLISNQNNKETGAIKNLRAITLHDRGFSTRFNNLYDEEFEKIHQLEESLKKDKNIITKSEETAIKEQITDLKGNLSNIREQDYKKWERIDEKDKPKVLFLSATPFSHVKNIDYAEGYLFKYDKKEDNGGYGQPTAQEDFLIQNFGYRMRYGRLEQPDADVDNSIMEINFCEKLKKDGALSNRRLIIDKDYDRGFILIDGGIGKKVDEGFEYLFNSKNNYQLLANFLNKNYDYYSKLFLLEAIKARESIKLIKEYQKTGKKIVVFHRYLKNESKHPFKLFFTDEQEKSMTPTTKRRLENEYERFCKERPDLVNLDLSELTSPIQTLQNAFGNKIAIYNGKLSAKEKDINLAKFNDDNSNVNIILVQADAGCAGISLHDKTGKHQRVLINLGLPTKPVEAIQTEGRIYRVGQKTNAIFRYLNTGTTMERTAFATNIAQRSETVENLALGEEARNLKQSFVEAFQDTINSDEWKKNLPGNANEGTGGKEKDYTNIGNRTDFDKAKAFYFANQKKNSSNKSAEGKDYFSTPEPLGLKMVEWSGLKDGESALEPSAGHGAVARWFPATTKNIAIEPSGQLADLTQMNFNGKVKNIPFEDFSIINKFDVITMNPPFGKGGKTAIEHIAKAFKHLYDGGRIVAIIPDGPACQKHFNNWFDSEDASSATLIKEITLPNIVFKRAGTSIGTKVIIIDKQITDKGKSAVQINKTTPIDLSNITNINEFFNAIKDIQIPDKLNPNKVPDLQSQIFSSTNSTNIKSNSTPDNLSNNSTEEIIPIDSNTTSNSAKIIEENNNFVMEDIEKQSFDKKEDIKLDLAKHYLHIKNNGDTITIFIKVPLSNKIYKNYMAPTLYKKDKYHYEAKRLRDNTVGITFKNHKEASDLVNEIEENIRKATNETNNATKAKKTTKYSGLGQMIPSLIDMDNLVTPDKLNSFEKGLSDFGTAIGCPILFFNNKKAKNIRGAFSGGIMYFNRASNISPRWTFYHEFIHWLKSTNPEVFKEIRIAIGDITATSILDYREQIVGGNDTFDGKPLLTDEDIIEEMIADHMFNTSTRIALNKLMAKNNPTLWQRFVAFWQNLLDRFRTIYSIPLGLDKTQGENMNRAMEKLVTSIKDKDGKVLFKRTKQGLVFAKDDMYVVNNKEIKINPTSVQPLSSNTTKLSSMKKSSVLYSLKHWWNNKWQGKPSKATNEQIKHHLELITNCKFEFGRLDNIYKEQGYIVHEYPPNNNLKKALGTIERIIRVDKAFNYAKMLEATAPIIAKDLGFTDQAMNDYIATWLFSRDEAQKDDIKFKKVNNAIKQKEQEDIQGELYAKNLIELQNLFHYFDEMTAKEAFKDSLYNKENSAKSGLKSKKDKIHDQFFDRYGPIQRLVNDYEKRTGKTLEYINPYEQFRLTAGSAGRGMTFLEGKGNEAKQALAEVYKTIDFTKFKTLNSILKDNNIDKSISDMEDFANYCIAMHEKEVLEYNKKVNSKEQIDVQHKPEHIEEIINNATNNIKQAHKELLQYQHTLMEVMQDGGLINRKQLQEIESKWKYYIPLYKFFDENEDIQFEHLKIERNDKVKKLNENAHRLTINPLEGIIVNTYKILKLAEKNKAKAYLTALLHQTGINEYIPELEVAKEGTSLKNSYSVYINGKKRTYTTTPEIVKAMADVTLGNKNLFGKIFQTMSTWIRATSTFLNPLFSVANGMRDVVTTWLYSKYGFKVTDFTSGLTASIFKNKYYWEYMASGAAQSALVSLDRNYTQASLNKIYRKTKPKWKQWIPTLEQLKNALQYVSEISEDTFRIAHYRAGKRYMEKQSQKNNDTNINISKVAYETRDIMDFSRYGASGKEWNDWAAFSNAALQGWSKTFRTLEHAKKDKQFRIKFLFKLGLLSLLALSLALWNSSDDDRRKKYNEIPQRIKDTHYIFIVGDIIFRIPKGLDPMIILSSGLIERGIDYVYDKNKSFLDFSKDTTLDMAKMLWGQIPGFLPTASTPIIEVLANRSFYFDMPIVPPAKENDMPRMQYDDYTSTASKFLGKEFNISPKKFEHILYSYTGYLGRTVNKTIDILADKNHSIQEKWQSTPLSEMAPTSRFLYTPYKSAASITKFYEDLKTQKALYKEYKENGIRPKEFNEGYYKKLIEAEKQMKKLNKKKQDILKNKSIPLVNRQSSFDSLNNNKLSIARKVLQYK